LEAARAPARVGAPFHWADRDFSLGATAIRLDVLSVVLARLCRRCLWPEHCLGGDDRPLFVGQVPSKQVLRVIKR
jgi:hypothetical protein